MKTKLSELAKKLKIDWAEAERLRDTKLEPEEWTGKGKNTWLNEEGAAKIELSVAVPPVVPDRFEGTVIAAAYNPSVVWCVFPHIPTKTPVFIPRRLHGNLIGKKIPVHAITDAKGTTYRHASLTGRYQ
jgi:hypothetical protein